MIVRDATLQDVETLLELSKEMHAESRYSVFSYDQEKVRALIEHLILSEDGIAIVSVDDKTITGALLAIISEHFFGHDKTSGDFGVFVSNINRRTKAGMMLVKEYKRKAIEAGVKDIGLGTTTGYEPELVGKLYEMIRFEKVGGNYRMRVEM